MQTMMIIIIIIMMKVILKIDFYTFYINLWFTDYYKYKKLIDDIIYRLNSFSITFLLINFLTKSLIYWISKYLVLLLNWLSLL